MILSCKLWEKSSTQAASTLFRDQIDTRLEPMERHRVAAAAAEMDRHLAQLRHEPGSESCSELPVSGLLQRCLICRAFGGKVKSFFHLLEA